ncbi:hypothetical protein FNF27_05158 [Cafeteria roenbergensis]|uniref:PPM-type phosphatase domain-containing protein n=1 Tax=Cafeteria roenbergensis TaxID=33653 RepID=A0A5A8EBY9_CAFRO|nr:hypothetical protein FNF27_05158 [Cafeteria roenbergensis]
MMEAPEGRADTLLLCVFDGHGDHGHLVSAHLERRVPAILFEHTDDQLAADPGGCARTALAKAEAELISDPTVETGLSGSTAVVCIVQRDVVTIANVGDSRAMLVQTDGRALIPKDLTADHKPTLPRETRRILLAGGELRAIRYPDGEEGPVRVWCGGGSDVPGLAMSRSVCDTVGKRAGVSSEPDITTTTLTKSDAFLVVASDGLWEFMEGDDVCTGILVAHGEAARAGDPASHLTRAVTELKAEAVHRWLEQEGAVDDTSIVLAEIGFVADEAETAGHGGQGVSGPAADGTSAPDEDADRGAPRAPATAAATSSAAAAAAPAAGTASA